ncbi:sphingolipid delta(4)-desaturase DES1-like [Amphibalanus amphitrite]|uniref:sphingolipid delta(4)-desaturase DES1-like n=1 Tax=Amphibalanus amphitrite TaxID=1232801 RepID=UPI001C917CF1|nr:sphingolipid delta(4)-desaturase DES1-like [Amphibalanus amphitrite]
MAPREAAEPWFDDTKEPEPHAARRKKILEAHPEVRGLFGHNPELKWQALCLVGVQLSVAYYTRLMSWPMLIAVAYFFGGFLQHGLWSVIHECSHNQAFGYKHPLPNQLLGILANLPMGFPCAVAFKRYHLMHHKYQGHAKLDADVPTEFEARLFGTSAIGKLIFVILQPFFYYTRPLFVNPLPPTRLELFNIAVQLAFDYVLLSHWGLKPFVYLIGGFLLTMGLHPLAGHFISDHMQLTKGHETYSYYGWMNQLMWNEGYHNEHHDFPNVPNKRLAELRDMVPEVYAQLPSYDSWPGVVWRFITDPTVSLGSRIRRLEVPQKTVTNVEKVVD